MTTVEQQTQSPEPREQGSVADMIVQSQSGLERLSIMHFCEVLPGLRTQSIPMHLDFSQFPPNLPDPQNIQRYFEACQAQGLDPRLAENRQRFNDQFIHESGRPYLIGAYAENRIAMLTGSYMAAEGRIYHLGVDIFTEGLDTLRTPTAGTVVMAGNDAGRFGYGYWLILDHEIDLEDSNVLYSLYGHLNSEIPSVGTIFKAGQEFATLGDFIDDENGGWSRHVHMQLLRELPENGLPPIGYSSLENLSENLHRFPDPNLLLQIPNSTQVR
jgi:hypothetical protein